ncbi:hypothetical protein [Gorillibacterium sp. CAU 1737]|uniref:hypothetical protein n=1 Tax=Gorillibacterium sp. CAU 1737 TaxID=3140362 RepID=UPI003261AD4F
MGVSLYYSAERPQPLTAEEQQTVTEWIQAYDLEKAKEDFETASSSEWEGFTVYELTDPTQPGVIFEGATRLPDDSPEAMWEGIQHWTALLARIRATLPGAEWHVHVDDHDLEWDEEAGEYDLSS